jgi:hypothetical protein
MKGGWRKVSNEDFHGLYSSPNTTGTYRGIDEFKRRYQLRTNLVKDQNCDLFADSQNIWVAELFLSLIVFEAR